VTARQAPRDYDVVAVGASPAILLEAMWQCQNGKRVAVLDRRDVLGGAWFTRTVWNYRGLEVGCHYIGNDHGVYGFLERITGVAMPSMKIDRLYASSVDTGESVEDGSPSAYQGIADPSKRIQDFRSPDRFLRAVYGQSLIPLRVAINLDAAFQVIRNRSLRGLARVSRNFLRFKEFRYLKGGCNELMESLTERITAMEIDIVPKCELKSVNGARDGICRCVTSSGDFRAGRVIAGQYSDFEVDLAEGRIPIPRRSINNNVHMVLKLAGNRRQPFTFVEVRNSPDLRAVSDVGLFCEDVDNEPDTLVLCCQLTHQASDRSIGPDEVLERLANLGLVYEDTVVVASQLEHYKADFVPDGELEELNGLLEPLITILNTHNLSSCFAANMNRWISLFEQKQAA
jgi:hypothetical protein